MDNQQRKRKLLIPSLKKEEIKIARPKTYSVNDSYFNKIDTERKAYWLGLLYADGYITRGGFGISLKLEDMSHVQQMLDDMGSDYKLKIYTNSTKSEYGATSYCRALINSQEIRKTLVNYGMVENKSLILDKPNIIFLNDELKIHFIRGFFDGNGSISGLKRKTYALKITSTDKMLKWIANSIGYKFKKLHKRRPSDIVSSLEISGINMVKKYGMILYGNSTVSLKRKYEKLIHICESE